MSSTRRSINWIKCQPWTDRIGSDISSFSNLTSASLNAGTYKLGSAKPNSPPFTAEPGSSECALAKSAKSSVPSST